MVLADEGVLRAFPGCRAYRTPWANRVERCACGEAGECDLPTLRAAIGHIELQQSVGVAVRDLGQILGR